MENKIRTDLLRKLADHLLNGKLGHDKFDFGNYNAGWPEKQPYQDIIQRNICGTAGCAMGEMPVLFPKHFAFDGNGVVLKHDYSKWDEAAGMKFFNITSEQYNHLFMPEDQMEHLGRTQNLTVKATKEDVAENIIAFCDLVDAGKITNE